MSGVAGLITRVLGLVRDWLEALLGAVYGGGGQQTFEINDRRFRVLRQAGTMHMHCWTDS